MEEVAIEKLVHGGQGLGNLADGRKVFVWNALPGERVRLRVIKAKRSFAEAIAEEIITPSLERIWSCCSQAATSERRMRISTALVNTGWTGKGEPSNERQKSR